MAMCTGFGSSRWMATDPTNSTPPIVRLKAADLTRLETLLRDNRLPSDDCAAQLPAFHGIFDASRLVAAGGLEAAGEYALLRSVVVDKAYRGRGLAWALTDHLIAEARRRRLHALYLLTETAEEYFVRFGFARVNRETAPATIRKTRQFADLCPDSAVFMQLRL